MAETELHGQIMTDCREILVHWFVEDPMVYVWGDLLVFYEEGNPRKHLSPDVFVVRGVRALVLRAGGRAPGDREPVPGQGGVPGALGRVPDRRAYRL